MASLYIAFGLKILSNIPIPGLVPLGDSDTNADIRMHLDVSLYSQNKILEGSEKLTYESSYRDDAGNPGLRIWKSPKGRYLHLVYHDRTEFWLEHRGKEIWAIWPEASTLEDACSYILGPVLGIVLRLRGVTCLHGSAVALEDRSVAFVGAEGAGKSTTAAAFAREGHGVLSDDIVALQEADSGFFVVPAYPHICLWPESVAFLYGSQDALPRFSKGWEKQRLTLGDRETHFESRPLSLAAIYFLGERRADSAPMAEPVQPKTGLLSLVTDSFANKVLDREMRAREFEVLGRLVGRIPVRRVYAHSDGSRIQDLCRVIREDLTSLRS